MTKLEQHTKAFLEVREILENMGEMFALARAYKKPYKWYGEHTTREAVNILIAEANNQFFPLSVQAVGTCQGVQRIS